MFSNVKTKNNATFLYSFQDDIGGQNIWVKFSSGTLVAD
jgi:hypothetical protein